MNCVFVVVLCLSAQLLCHPSSVLSKKGTYAEKELLDNTSILDGNVEESQTEINLKIQSNKKLIKSSSSDESKSSEETKTTIGSSESLSSSSSLSSESIEVHHIKKVQKRSLESKIESVNSIGNNVNQTITKTNSLEKNTTSVFELPDSTPLTKDPSADRAKEPNSENAESTKEYEIVSATESTAEGTTSTSEAEATTETENPSTTKIQDGTTEAIAVEDEQETGSEVVPETTLNQNPEINYQPTTETDPETASEVNSPTSEVNNEKTKEEANSTTEAIPPATTQKLPELIQTSSEDSDDEIPYYSQSTTPSTDMEVTTPKEYQPQTLMEKAMDRVNKLSEQIRLVLSTYKKVGVVVVPGQSFFPEPMEMQDFKQSFSVGTMDFKNMKVYGLSNFTVEHINTDVDRMQVYILLHMKRLVIIGNYTLRTFFSRAAGPFNVTLLDVDSEGVAEVQSAPEGYLEAADSEMDMFTKDMQVDFKNLGFMGSMFQGMVSAVGDALFNSIKPQILERVNLVIRSDVNKKLKEFSTKFINKVKPVDLAFSEGRRYCKAQGYDPYHISDHTFLLGGLVYVNITDFWVEGLSRFHRVGNLSLSMDSGVIEISVHVMTGKLTGHCHWTGQTFGIVKYGNTNFTVDHLQVRAMVHQSLDVRKKPQLSDLDLELGWVKVSMNSPMTLNLMIEGIINAFPRLIRHIIVDTLEQPLKEKVQEILNQINVEAIVDENLPRLDTFGL